MTPAEAQLAASAITFLTVTLGALTAYLIRRQDRKDQAVREEAERLRRERDRAEDQAERESIKREVATRSREIAVTLTLANENRRLTDLLQHKETLSAVAGATSAAHAAYSEANSVNAKIAANQTSVVDLQDGIRADLRTVLAALGVASETATSRIG